MSNNKASNEEKRRDEGGVPAHTYASSVKSNELREARASARQLGCGLRHRPLLKSLGSSFRYAAPKNAWHSTGSSDLCEDLLRETDLLLNNWKSIVITAF